MDAMVQPKLDRYLRIIGQYDSEFSKWAARTKKIIKRYRDDTRGQTAAEAGQTQASEHVASQSTAAGRVSFRKSFEILLNTVDTLRR